VSLLQYANDSIIIGDGTKRNWVAIKCVLRMFELVVGLKANFHKSHLIGINIQPEVLDRAAEFLNCCVGLPFNYLGVPMGINHKQKGEWQTLLNRLKSRLFAWKSRHISFGGRGSLS